MESVKGFKNSRILTENGIVKANLIIENGVIARIGGDECDGLAELEGDKLIIPGLIDQHVHGASGCDTMDGTEDALATIAASLAKEGVTAFLATTTTQSRDNLTKALSAVNAYMQRKPGLGAEVLGVHLEGPFISKVFAGAQLPEYVATPDRDVFSHYQRASGNNIRLVSMEVETETALSLIPQLVSEGVVVSVGHSNATYDRVEMAVAAGARCVTHTYNAQRPLHHREVGVVGAAMLNDKLYCEAICDGIHLSAPAVRLLWKTKPRGKLILISDALRAKNMPNGCYTELGGQPTVVENGVARLPDGTLAGSVLKMNTAVKNAMGFMGTDLAEAVRLATENPAKNLGVFDKMGSIAVGKAANLAVVDGEMNVYRTIRNGKTIFSI